jgi:phosphatidylethanolamine-binding protein (PEBP) family uncharacterized protein
VPHKQTNKQTNKQQKTLTADCDNCSTSPAANFEALSHRNASYCLIFHDIDMIPVSLGSSKLALALRRNIDSQITDPKNVDFQIVDFSY